MSSTTHLVYQHAQDICRFHNFCLEFINANSVEICQKLGFLEFAFQKPVILNIKVSIRPDFGCVLTATAVTYAPGQRDLRKPPLTAAKRVPYDACLSTFTMNQSQLGQLQAGRQMLIRAKPLNRLYTMGPSYAAQFVHQLRIAVVFAALPEIAVRACRSPDKFSDFSHVVIINQEDVQRPETCRFVWWNCKKDAHGCVCGVDF